MKRSGALVRAKYLEYLSSTMAFSLSIYVAAIVDGILVGKLISPEAFTAVNLTMPVVYVKNILFCLFISGGSTLVSQLMGARKYDQCHRTFSLALGGGVSFAVLMALVGALTAPALAGFLAGSGSLAAQVRNYLIPLWILAPFVNATNGSAAFMRLEGRHKLAAAIPIAANVVNLLCDVLYIRVFVWGIAGAGWATVTGYATAALLLIPWLRDKNRTLRFVRVRFGDLPQLVKIWKVGLPISLIDACDMLRNYNVNATMLSLLGDAGGQIIAVCNAAMLYAAMIADGASTAMSTVVGALYGEEDRTGMMKVLTIAFALTLSLCLLIFTLIELFPAAFAGIYGVKEAAMLNTLVPWLRLYILAITLIVPLYVLRSFYQSTGYENVATALSVLEGAVFMIPIFYALSHVGIFAMALAYSIATVLSLVVVILWMQRRAKLSGCGSFLMMKRSEMNKSWEASVRCIEQDAMDASQTLMDFCKANGLPSKVSGAVGISAEELCVNIIRYAGLKPSDHIDLFFHILDDRVVLKTRDSGKIFNPTEYVVDDRVVTGLKLIRSLSSKIEYHQILGFNTTIITCGVP